MKEETPAFTVVDKRKFTPEGSVREGYSPSEPTVTEIKSVQPAPTTESAKVVTMPSPQAPAIADDLAGEDMQGSLHPVETMPAPQQDDGEVDLIGDPRSAEETAAQHAAYRQSSRELDTMLKQANPGMEAPGAVTFEHVIQSFYLSAAMAMGAGAEPNQQPRIDIIGARQSIDMLAVLEEKTRGNLTEREQQLLQGITFELRMMFMELTNAISKQAQQPPPRVGGPQAKGPSPVRPR